MNRQIKFCGKSADGKWLYGDLRQFGRQDKDLNDKVGIYPVDDDWRGCPIVDENSVGQFTGLYDWNKTPIYEGDIVRFPPKDKWEETSFVGYEVFFHNKDCCDKHIGFQMNRHHFYGHICGTSDFWNFVPQTTKRTVIIGNIHDNPADSNPIPQK